MERKTQWRNYAMLLLKMCLCDIKFVPAYGVMCKPVLMTQVHEVSTKAER